MYKHLSKRIIVPIIAIAVLFSAFSAPVHTDAATKYKDNIYVIKDSIMEIPSDVLDDPENHPGDRHEVRTVEGPVGDTGLCPTCEGEGRVLCSVCHGDYISGCSACEGTGRTLCRACTENGLHIRGVCARCLGTGLTDR